MKTPASEAAGHRTPSTRGAGYRSEALREQASFEVSAGDGAALRSELQPDRTDRDDPFPGQHLNAQLGTGSP